MLLSRTILVVQLRPDEIEFRVGDLYAPDDADDRRFEKPDCYSQFYERHDTSIVMNVGCSQNDPWLFWQAARKLGLSSVPSALQARIGEGKGVFVSKSEDIPKERPQRSCCGFLRVEPKSSQSRTAQMQMTNGCH